MDRVRASIKEALKTSSTVSAVALFHQYLGHNTPSTHPLSHGDTFTLTDLFAPLQEEVILIWNPSREYIAADDLIRRHLAPELGQWVDL